jgi:hypothetical protein
MFAVLRCQLELGLVNVDNVIFVYVSNAEGIVTKPIIFPLEKIDWFICLFGSGRSRSDLHGQSKSLLCSTKLERRVLLLEIWIVIVNECPNLHSNCFGECNLVENQIEEVISMDSLLSKFVSNMQLSENVPFNQPLMDIVLACPHA